MQRQPQRLRQGRQAGFVEFQIDGGDFAEAADRQALIGQGRRQQGPDLGCAGAAVAADARYQCWRP